MSYMHPAALEHRRKYWLRPDAYRFAAPGTPEAKMPGYLHPWAAVARAEKAAQDEARARVAAEQGSSTGRIGAPVQAVATSVGGNGAMAQSTRRKTFNLPFFGARMGFGGASNGAVEKPSLLPAGAR